MKENINRHKRKSENQERQKIRKLENQVILIHHWDLAANTSKHKIGHDVSDANYVINN